MRKVLNTLQYVASLGRTIDASVVYSSMFLPSPQQMQDIFQLLLNESFELCYNRLGLFKAESGCSLNNLLEYTFNYLTELEFPKTLQIYLFEKLSNLETCIATGGNEQMHLAALVGIFQIGRTFVDRI